MLLRQLNTDVTFQEILHRGRHVQFHFHRVDLHWSLPIRSEERWCFHSRELVHSRPCTSPTLVLAHRDTDLHMATDAERNIWADSLPRRQHPPEKGTLKFTFNFVHANLLSFS